MKPDAVNDKRPSDASGGEFAPLRDILVVDLTRVLAGPLCTQYLADLGATVVKVESRDGGDDTRGWPPFVGEDGAIFLSVNRNKQSISLDLKSTEGKEIVTRLVRKADIFIESFRKGVIERLGLDYQTLKAIKPDLVYCSISGFGRTGDLSSQPGYDLMAQAFSGIMSITGEKDRLPVRSSYSPMDQTTGINAVVGILAALRHRDATGQGQYLEVSLFESALGLLGYVAQAFWASGRLPERRGTVHESLCPYQAFVTKDEPILVGVGNDSLWRSFSAAIGLGHLASDPKFATNAARVACFDETVRLVSEKIALKSSAEWEVILSAAGVPHSAINSIDRVLALQHTQQREMIMSYEHPHYGPLKGMALPIHFAERPRTVRSAPPLVGEHTSAVLRSIGYAAEDIENLKKQGVVHQADELSAVDRVHQASTK